MIFFLISIFAGILTVLAPCILPLLPMVINSNSDSTKVSKRSNAIIISLCISIVLFTLIIKSGTFFLNIPERFWQIFSGTIVVLLGLITMFPNVWNNFYLVNKVNQSSNKFLGTGYTKNNLVGNIMIGLSLGPIFTTCSPTYLFILATVLPSKISLGIFYLLGFVIGLSISLYLIAYLGSTLVNKLGENIKNINFYKKIMGIIFLLIGLAIIFGYDKKISTLILDSGYRASIDLEENLINKFK